MDEWREILKPPQIVAALQDRLKHHCVTINMIDADSPRRLEPETILQKLLSSSR